MSNNENIIYRRIVLKPLEKFRFGGEKSEFQTDYLLPSQRFPQQTGILGLMRYEVLRRKGLLTMKGSGEVTISDFNEAKENWIGSGSFSATNGQTFGVIESISPVFIRYKKNGKDVRYIPGWSMHNKRPDLELEALPAKVSFHSEILREKFYLLKDYDPKKPPALVLISEEGDQKSINARFDENTKRAVKDSGVFVSDWQVGIIKNYEGKQKDEAGKKIEKGFYKMEYLRMIPGFSYEFVVGLLENVKDLFPNGDTQMVMFGAERSYFQMKVYQAVEYHDHKEVDTGNKISLISDAFVNDFPALYRNCQLVFATGTQHFRNFKTRTEKGQRYNVKPTREHTYRSKTLLKKGTVIFTDNLKEIKQILKNDTWRKIGYNHFTVGKSKRL